MATIQPKSDASKKPAAKDITVGGTSLDLTVPQSYTWAQAGLLYEQRTARGTWISLEPAPGKEGYPVSLMVDGNIAISQANQEATCTCKFERGFHFSLVDGSDAGKDYVTLYMVDFKAPEFSFGGQQPELAKQFPLATALVSVNGLQLKIPPSMKWTSTKPKRMIHYMTPKQIIEHVEEILTRKETLDIKRPILVELSQLQYSADETLADREGRAAMASNEKEVEAARRLEAFEQEAARWREALKQDQARRLEVFKQDQARRLEVFKQEVARRRELFEQELLREMDALEAQFKLKIEKLDLEQDR